MGGKGARNGGPAAIVGHHEDFGFHSARDGKPVERLEEKGMAHLHFNMLTRAALLNTDHIVT